MKFSKILDLTFAKPDLLADSEPGGCLRTPGFTKLKIQSEDPHRKMYKKVLSIVFIILTGANLILDIAYQVLQIIEYQNNIS